MKKISILGSTGSIGKTTLDVIRQNPNLYEVIALSANTNILEIEKQAREFNPKIIAIFDEKKAKELRKKIPNIKIVSGLDGLIEIVSLDEVDFVMSSICGFIGLIPTIHAIKKNKTIGLANKEVMVSAGDFVNSLLDKHSAKLIPVDSEHNAIFQCLKNEKTKDVKRIILTASGGPFFNYSIEKLSKITLNDALNHPTYKMGKKISVDSSTLMNKGLEIIEAYHLFKLDIDQIDVVIHPQSIIHSFVEFIDGSILAQMSKPNMYIPISYSLSYPNRIKSNIEKFDFIKNDKLSFFQPDLEKFKCLRLAIDAIKEKKSYPCFLNAANEVLVEKFLNKKISYLDISNKLEQLITFHKTKDMLSLDDILEVDKQARDLANKLC
ncbi:MAG: 1-deoxy-D-xylulose 5-phosphate reductoisomerase [Candidatus Anoxychlamydiales bacterium]|nr:1-deoxy-D-xylulose 5-phosphate reductoisomerase [Candidatus Anoxychlamydiales bacterium]